MRDRAGQLALRRHRGRQPLQHRARRGGHRREQPALERRQLGVQASRAQPFRRALQAAQVAPQRPQLPPGDQRDRQRDHHRHAQLRRELLGQLARALGVQRPEQQQLVGFAGQGGVDAAVEAGDQHLAAAQPAALLGAERREVRAHEPDRIVELRVELAHALAPRRRIERGEVAHQQVDRAAHEVAHVVVGDLGRADQHQAFDEQDQRQHRQPQSQRHPQQRGAQRHRGHQSIAKR